MSSGKLVVGGEHRGTAWMASERLAVTAAHCMRPGESEGELHFGAKRFGIRVVDNDTNLDAALLEIITPTVGLPRPLELTARPEMHVPSGWRSIGFPEAMLSTYPDGFALDGTVAQYPPSSANVTSTPLMQLTCSQGPTNGNPAQLDSRGRPYPVFAGASGGPVCLDACAGRVVGIIRRAPPLLSERTLAATPVDLIHARFPTLRESAALHPWPLQVSLHAARDPLGELRTGSSLPLDRATEAWAPQHRLLQIVCDFRPDEHPPLAAALLRLALHARTSELQSRRHEDWRHEGKSLGKVWLPLLPCPIEQLLQSLRWFELPDAPSTLSSDAASADDASRLIHEACDRWVFHEICRHLHRLLGRGDDGFPDAGREIEALIGCQINSEFAAPMCRTWTTWRDQLRSSPSLLQHFLTLMLTHRGGYRTAQAVIGAGPITVERCLVPAVVFCLAVNVGLHPSHELRAESPGNLGVPDEEQGHLCAIEVIDGRRLNLAVNFYGWDASVVFLPRLESVPDFYEAIQRRQNQRSDGRAVSLKDMFPKTLLLALDRDLASALSNGVEPLADYLRGRRAKLGREQSEYYREVTSRT